MSIDTRIASIFKEVSGKVFEESFWHQPLGVLGLDSLEILDLFYELETEFRVPKLADGELLTDKNTTLFSIKSNILSRLVVPASAE